VLLIPVVASYYSEAGTVPSSAAEGSRLTALSDAGVHAWMCRSIDIVDS
jgi:hypothetical protein